MKKLPSPPNPRDFADIDSWMTAQMAWLEATKDHNRQWERWDNRWGWSGSLPAAGAAAVNTFLQIMSPSRSLFSLTVTFMSVAFCVVVSVWYLRKWQLRKRDRILQALAG